MAISQQILLCIVFISHSTDVECLKKFKINVCKRKTVYCRAHAKRTNLQFIKNAVFVYSISHYVLVLLSCV